jgi:medium-chain acyl-[acyl-carrier-protein] hydrolase
MNPWFGRRAASSSSALRVLCLPYAGSGSNVFLRWQRSLPAGVEVCPIALPGRETRIAEPPFVAIDPLIDAMAAAIGDTLDRPYVLFGHSMGALLAFDLTRQLRRLGLAMPAHLVVSGRAAPQRPLDVTAWMSSDDSGLLAEMGQLARIPVELLEDRDAAALVLRVLRADIQVIASHAHRDEPPLDVPITAFAGQHDPLIHHPLEEWGIHTRAAFATHLMPGGHFFLHEAQDQFLERLCGVLTALVAGNRAAPT